MVKKKRTMKATRISTLLVPAFVAALAFATTVRAQTIESGVVKLAHANIEYFSQGQGEAVVLLPGGSLDVGYLEPLAAKLAEAGYRAVRVNPRGAGKSSGPGKGVTYHTYAADVAGVIQSLQLKSANVVGHAFGNRIARTLAFDHPELVRSVILLAAGGKVRPDPATEQALGMIFNPKASEAQIMEAMKAMVGDPANSAQVWQVIKPSRAPKAATAQARSAAATPEKDWWAPPGKVPYLVVQGGRDKVALAENARLLKQDLGDRLTVVEIATAGHMMPVENPDEVSSAVVSFLRRIGSAPTGQNK